MNRDGLIIRAASEADLPAILDLYAQPGMDDGEKLPIEEARALFHKMARYPYYRLFVVERGACVVASYALLVMDNIAHLGKPSAIVEQVMVDPDTQGLGLGTAMMEHALAEARAQGCYKLALSSNMKRERAHAFYDKFGFTRHGYSFLVDLGPT
jgi:ribosomal protein S18 acetylase RimI-like enzyme